MDSGWPSCQGKARWGSEGPHDLWGGPILSLMPPSYLLRLKSIKNCRALGFMFQRKSIAFATLILIFKFDWWFKGTTRFKKMYAII
jgi:hypothetical protein